VRGGRQVLVAHVHGLHGEVEDDHAGHGEPQ
jgi:hypothetical protein